MADGPQVTRKGIDGEITLTPTHVTIKHFWTSKNGRGTATYPLTAVTGVEFRPGALQGRFTLIVPGAVQRGDKKADPLTILTGKKYEKDFLQLRDLVLEGMDANRVAAAAQAAQAAAAAAPPQTVPAGLAEQIAQLAALHAQNVLSDAEFAAAKARILGQPAGPQDQAPAW